jgi:CheY-like chemotaxis protein
MQQVRLIHWNAREAEERAAKLRAWGYSVDAAPPKGGAGLRPLKENPPAAVVIDLTRLPSQGRDVALFIRHTRATRHVPLVFVEGEAEKIRRIQEHLPDAVYTTWKQIRAALKRAIAQPPVKPVVPASALAGYSGTPLLKKLGIKANSVIALVGAPDDFEETLGDLPDGAELRRQSRGRCDVAMMFVRSRAELERSLDLALGLAKTAGVWLAWPKQSSGVASDLTQNVVRNAGLAAGLVDYKICAIDATWSGLKFTRRNSRGKRAR